jgi:hypothetical protein
MTVLSPAVDAALAAWAELTHRGWLEVIAAPAPAMEAIHSSPPVPPAGCFILRDSTYLQDEQGGVEMRPPSRGWRQGVEWHMILIGAVVVGLRALPQGARAAPCLTIPLTGLPPAFH